MDEPVTGWVSCSERLPPPLNDGTPFSDTVLVCVGSDCFDPYVEIGVFNHRQRVWLKPDLDRVISNWSEVTHWRPLPEPPA